MGNFSSIEELKNSTEIRELIKKGISNVYEMQREYDENVSEVKTIDAKYKQIGTNNVDSGGGVVIGSGKDGIKIKQNTNIQTEAKTLYFGNYIANGSDGNPITELASAEMLEMTKKDNSDEIMPNFYDAKYILGLLGINGVKDAHFVFIDDSIDGDNRENEIGGYIEYKLNENEITNEIDKQRMNGLSAMIEFVMNELNAVNKENELNKENDEATSESIDGELINKSVNEANKLIQSLNELNNERNDNETIHSLISQMKEKLMRCKCLRYKFLNLKDNEFLRKELKYSCASDEGIRVTDEIENKLNMIIETSSDSLNNTSIISSTNSVIKIFKLINDGSIEIDDELIKTLTECNNYLHSAYVSVAKNILNSFDENKSSKKEIELYTSCIEYVNELNKDEELKESVNKLMNQFTNKLTNSDDVRNELLNLNFKIDLLVLQLTNPDIINYTKHYEYYETENIDEKLIQDLNNDYNSLESDLRQYDFTICKNLRDINSLTPYEKLLHDLFDCVNSFICSEKDCNSSLIKVYSNSAFQSNLYQCLNSENRKKLNEEMNEILNQMMNSGYFTPDDKIDEYPKIVCKVNDEELTSLYIMYLEKMKEYDDLVSLYSVVNCKNNVYVTYTEQKELKELYETYASNIKESMNLKQNYENALDELLTFVYDEEMSVEMSNKLIEWVKMRVKSAEYKNMITMRDMFEGSGEFGYSKIMLNDLYDMLVSGFMCNIREKVEDIKTKSTNLIENITRSTYLYSMNNISIVGKLENVDISQENIAIQKLSDGMNELIDESAELLRNDKVNGKMKTNKSVTSINIPKLNSKIESKVDVNNVLMNNGEGNSNSEGNKSKNKNVVLIVILVLLIACVAAAVLIIIYRKRYIKKQLEMEMKMTIN